MITSSDAEILVLKKAKELGITTYPWGNIPEGKILSDRVTVRAKGVTPSTYWSKCFVEVNLSVPDIDGEKNGIRLQELEREGARLFGNYTDSYDGTVYRVRISSSEVMEDKQFDCHYVNIRLSFEILNTQ